MPNLFAIVPFLGGGVGLEHERIIENAFRVDGSSKEGNN